MMSACLRRTWLPLLLVGASMCVAPAHGAKASYQEVGRRKPWYSLLRPARTTPAEQLAYARALREGGHWVRASRHYRALVASWPSSPEAPVAQREVAELLDGRGRTEAAFEQYQRLLDRYGTQAPFEDVVRRQLEIAKETMEKRRYRLLFGGFHSPETALPLLGHVVTNAPQMEVAAEAQFLLGRVHAEAEDFHEAVHAFTEVQSRFPESPFAAPAAFGRAESLYRLSRRAPENDALAEEAWFALDLYVRRHADSPEAEKARAWRDEVFANRARRAYEKARFYERVARKRAAALDAYRLFVRRFPASEWTPRAKARIQELETLLGDTKPDETATEDLAPSVGPDRPPDRD